MKSELAKAKQTLNPVEPPSGQRRTFLISFDWGEGSTKGMVDALRQGGFHTKTADRLPRTTIVCRTPKTTKDEAVLKVVADTLLDKGSATVTPVGGDRIHIWPDKPWGDEPEKRWGATLA